MGTPLILWLKKGAKRRQRKGGSENDLKNDKKKWPKKWQAKRGVRKWPKKKEGNETKQEKEFVKMHGVFL